MRRRVGLVAGLGIAVALWTALLPTSLDALWPWAPPEVGSAMGRVGQVVDWLLQPTIAYLGLVALALGALGLSACASGGTSTTPGAAASGEVTFGNNQADPIPKAAIEAVAVASEAFQRFAEGAAPRKVIVVPKRLVNLVV